jgi:hypothetical protein
VKHYQLAGHIAAAQSAVIFMVPSGPSQLPSISLMILDWHCWASAAFLYKTQNNNNNNNSSNKGKGLPVLN